MLHKIRTQTETFLCIIIEKLEGIKHMYFTNENTSWSDSFLFPCIVSGTHTFFSMAVTKKGILSNCFSDKTLERFYKLSLLPNSPQLKDSKHCKRAGAIKLVSKSLVSFPNFHVSVLTWQSAPAELQY